MGSTVLVPDDFVIMTNGVPVERDNSVGILVWSGDEIAVANAPQDGWLGTQADLDGQSPVSDCSASAELTGFARGSAALSGIDLQSLDLIMAASEGGACSVTITGYADVSGSDMPNRRITAARTAAVLDELIANGARFPSASIVATDGTDSAGVEKASSWRVTVQLWGPLLHIAAQPQADPRRSVAALLGGARNAGIEHVLVLGWQSTGDLYIGSSNNDPRKRSGCSNSRSPA